MENFGNVLLEYLENKYNISNTVKQCVIQLLKQLENGSVCLNITDSNKKEELLNSSAVGIVKDLKDREEQPVHPLIFYEENLYVQRYFIYQTRIMEKIEKLLNFKKIHIITGGPGTGKTTSLANILKDKSDKKILIAAPTGKAAIRMKESLISQNIQTQTQTLHRLLGYIPLSVNFRHTKENPLDADIIAIDECSMIDLPMTAKLLDAVPENCDLYLLGDKNQLASVEAGSVFADICEKYKDNKEIYKELSVNYRAKDAPGIDNLSKQILNGSVKDFNNENVKYLENCGLSWYENQYESLFNAKDVETALEFLKKFQILCATKTGKNGTAAINKKLREIAKNKNAAYIPIIITQNCYNLNLFNGDVGVKNKESAYFYTDGKIDEVPVLTLPKYESAFAITIHKSQGSEYERAAVIYPNKDIENEDERMFLTRELLYTAVTCVKKECFIFGDRDALLNSCKIKIVRASGIK